MSNTVAIAQGPGSDPIIRLVIADHGIVREGLRAILDAEPDLAVAGLADPGDDLVEVVERTRPDVIILNPRFAGTGAAGLCARLVADHPRIRVLLVSSSSEIDLVWACIAAGAHGYVFKDIDRPELMRAVREVHRNEIAVSSQFAGEIIDQMRALVRLRTKAADWRPVTVVPDLPTTDGMGHVPVEQRQPWLTPRERQIVARLMDGERAPAIAAELYVSQSTVRNHLSSVFKKFGVASQVELVRRLRPDRSPERTI